MGLITAELMLANLLYCFDWKFLEEVKEEDLNMKETTTQGMTITKKTSFVLVPFN